MVKALRKCEECGKMVKRTTMRFGHFFCGCCKRRSSFPKLYSKLGMDTIKFKPKKKRGRYARLKWDERKFLWVKHIKETGDETKANEMMKKVLEAVKNAHIQAEDAQDKQKPSRRVIMPYEEQK